MNLQELVDEIVLETDMKKPKVRKIARIVFDKIFQKLELEEIIRTPSIVIRPKKSKDETSNTMGLIKKTPPTEQSTEETSE